MSYFLWIAQAAQDVRCALRQFRSSQAFTLAVTLSLACGIGANTASFSAINSLLLKSLPVPNPLLAIALRRQSSHHRQNRHRQSNPAYGHWRHAA